MMNAGMMYQELGSATSLQQKSSARRLLALPMRCESILSKSHQIWKIALLGHMTSQSVVEGFMVYSSQCGIRCHLFFMPFTIKKETSDFRRIFSRPSAMRLCITSSAKDF